MTEMYVELNLFFFRSFSATAQDKSGLARGVLKKFEVDKSVDSVRSRRGDKCSASQALDSGSIPWRVELPEVEVVCPVAVD
jgi:hypothetical protein